MYSIHRRLSALTGHNGRSSVIIETLLKITKSLKITVNVFQPYLMSASVVTGEYWIRPKAFSSNRREPTLVISLC